MSGGHHWAGLSASFLLAGAEPTFWMPVQGSSAAPGVDRLFQFILIIAAVFFLIVLVLMTLFVVRYRRRPGVEAVATPTHNTPLELAWTIIPLILVLFIFYFGFGTYLDMSVPPQNSYEILVTAQKWNWQFTYPNGYVDATLHVPVDTPVRLVLSSEDVIHAFYVPAFRLKKDVVPGRYNKTWFRATVPGRYTLFCAEYCGTKHSEMLSEVVVHQPGGFETWLADAANFVDRLPPAEAGQRLYSSRGCGSCHSVNGKASIGPTFKGFFGSSVVLKGGQRVAADEDYVRESILEPMTKVVAGYDPVMPTFKGRITDKEITAIIEYLKTVR